MEVKLSSNVCTQKNVYIIFFFNSFIPHFPGMEVAELKITIETRDGRDFILELTLEIKVLGYEWRCMYRIY